MRLESTRSCLNLHRKAPLRETGLAILTGDENAGLGKGEEERKLLTGRQLAQLEFRLPIGMARKNSCQ
jgi:hypothetical protein